jgi:preprotein translocase subunit SecG
VNVGDALSWAQIILALALTVILLLQTKGAGLTGIFGGGDSSVYRTRRGLELVMFRVTIILAVLFFLTSLINSLIPRIPA